MADVTVEKKRSNEPAAVSRRGDFDPWYGFMSPFTTSPFSLMRRLMPDIDRGFGGGFPQFGGEEALWSPAIEVDRQDGNIVVHADLPGMTEKDIKVEATEGGLLIEGERRREQEHKTEWGGYRSERSYGRFCRYVPLPEGARVEEAKAHFRNGVLEVSVPATEPERHRRQIPIQGSTERK